MPLVRLLRDLAHLAWQGHNPRWHHPDDSFTRWALREQAVFIISCSVCDENYRRRIGR